MMTPTITGKQEHFYFSILYHIVIGREPESQFCFNTIQIPVCFVLDDHLSQ